MQRQKKSIRKTARRTTQPEGKEKKSQQVRSLPRTEAQYVAAPERLKQTWDRVLNVISKMRTDKISLAKASRDESISPRTVQRWSGTALRKGQNGKYVAKRTDNFLRELNVLTAKGQYPHVVRGSKQATLLSKYSNALDRFNQTGDPTALNAFQGKQVTDAKGATLPFLTDPATIKRLASAGVLSFQSLYARTT